MSMPMNPAEIGGARPVLHVCVTCRAGEACDDGRDPPGARLYGALEQLNADAGAPVDLRPVACLAACDRGCTAAISTPGQFGYLLGGLSASIAGDVLDYAQRYRTAKNGFVLLSKRAASLRDSILGRMPASDIDSERSERDASGKPRRILPHAAMSPD